MSTSYKNKKGLRYEITRIECHSSIGFNSYQLQCHLLKTLEEPLMKHKEPSSIGSCWRLKLKFPRKGIYNDQNCSIYPMFCLVFLGGGGGKKGKKKKGKTVALTEFLSQDSSTPYIAPARKVDWADESEDPSGEINCKFSSVYCGFWTPVLAELFYKFCSYLSFYQSIHLFICHFSTQDLRIASSLASDFLFEIR